MARAPTQQKTSTMCSANNVWFLSLSLALHTLACMRLGAGDTPKAAVKVAARNDEIDCLWHIDGIEAAEEREARESAIGEARVDLAPGVPSKGPVRLLQALDNCALSENKKEARKYERKGYIE